MSGSNDTKPKEVVTLSGLPPMLEVDEVSRILRMNRNTVYDAGKRGEIPGYIKIRNSVRFVRDILLAWIRGGGQVANMDTRP